MMFRYRDLETGTFLTRDPAGFIDGPNLYAYVLQNPWSKFDPEGLQVVTDNPQDVEQPESPSGDPPQPYTTPKLSDLSCQVTNPIGWELGQQYYQDYLRSEDLKYGGISTKLYYLGADVGLTMGEVAKEVLINAPLALAPELALARLGSAALRTGSAIRMTEGAAANTATAAAPGARVMIGGVQATEIAGRLTPAKMAALGWGKFRKPPLK